MQYEFETKHKDGTFETGKADTWRTHAITLWDEAEWKIEMLCETYTAKGVLEEHLQGIDFLDREIRPVWDADPAEWDTDWEEMFEKADGVGVGLTFSAHPYTTCRAGWSGAGKANMNSVDLANDPNGYSYEKKAREVKRMVNDLLEVYGLAEQGWTYREPLPSGSWVSASTMIGVSR